MEAYTNITIKMETNEFAHKAVEIIEDIAANRTPVFETELSTFIADIEIKENIIDVDKASPKAPLLEITITASYKLIADPSNGLMIWE